VDDLQLGELISRLRRNGGDDAAVEVKSAAGGLPSSMAGTLCALANLPGGGVVVLGVDERAGFTPVGLTAAQAHTLRQGLAAQARKQLVPPAAVTFSQNMIDGRQVVVAVVAECPRAAKPCRLSSGTAMLRGYDGDYAMSEMEAQGFLALREQPMCDRGGVPGTSLDDLDDAILHDWMRTVRTRDSAGLGRFNDDEMPRRGEVVLANGEVTLAALLAMGKYPQQYFPRLVISAAWMPGGGASAVRAPVVLGGPIPAVMDQALEWARATFPNVITSSPDGSRRDAAFYPLPAFRELVSNAMIHRDLEAWSRSLAVEIRVGPEHLRITSPGGLYGVTTDTIGRTQATTTRNTRLLTLCQYLHTSANGGRVVEALATGIPIVRRELEDAGLPEPLFFDDGLRFTVKLLGQAHARPTPRLGRTQFTVLELLSGGTRSIAEMVPDVAVGEKAVARAVRELVRKGLVVQDGGRGRVTTYHLADRQP
jgi:ATP-dependent DNA helicase RecG